MILLAECPSVLYQRATMHMHNSVMDEYICAKLPQPGLDRTDPPKLRLLLLPRPWTQRPLGAGHRLSRLCRTEYVRLSWTLKRNRTPFGARATHDL